MLDVLPRLPLAHLPTPLEPLPRLAAALQEIAGGRPIPRLWVKRDDQTGLASGGNKTRKLEYLLADAMAEDADTVLTVGAPQSNHCRQTAAAAAKAGLRCVLVLGGSAPLLPGGNWLLDQLFNAEIVWAGQRDRLAVLAEVAESQRSMGYRPYTIPYGGSNSLGAAGYATACQELLAQAQALGLRIDHMAVASSSGGTQAGLMVGAWAAGFEGVVHGISIDRPAAELRAALAGLATETAALLGVAHRFDPEEAVVHDAYLGGGYGVLGDAERTALHLLARTEGLLLDPVYTGRAMAGLLDLIHQGRFQPDDAVVFWHTGGLPAIFAYGEELL